MTFTVLEGLDGVGTTTCARLIAEGLRLAGHDVVLTSEPTDSQVGQLLRRWLKTGSELDVHAVSLIFSADRALHLDEVIRPALNAGKHVICDRYVLSTLAYQGACGADIEWLANLSAPFDIPDKTVVLEVSEDERQRRLARRNDPERFDSVEWAEKLSQSYFEAAEVLRRRGHDIAFIDGSGTPADVAKRVAHMAHLKIN